MHGIMKLFKKNKCVNLRSQQNSVCTVRDSSHLFFSRQLLLPFLLHNRSVTFTNWIRYTRSWSPTCGPTMATRHYKKSRNVKKWC